MVRIRLICNYYRTASEAERDIARQQPDGIRESSDGQKTMFILTLKRGNTLTAIAQMAKLWFDSTIRRTV